MNATNSGMPKMRMEKNADAPIANGAIVGASTLLVFSTTKRNPSALRVTTGKVMAMDRNRNMTTPDFSITDGAKCQMVSIPGHVAPDNSSIEKTSSLPEIFLRSSMWLMVYGVAKTPNEKS